MFGPARLATEEREGGDGDGRATTGARWRRRRVATSEAVVSTPAVTDAPTSRTARSLALATLIHRKIEAGGKSATTPTRLSCPASPRSTSATS